MNNLLLIGALFLLSMVGGCASTKLVYEDSNVAIYRVCDYVTPLQIPVCRKQVINKRATEVNVNERGTGK